MILGTAFPPRRGGPCRWADEHGRARIHRYLERLAAPVVDRFQPSEALGEAGGGGGFASRNEARATAS